MIPFGSEAITQTGYSFIRYFNSERTIMKRSVENHLNFRGSKSFKKVMETFTNAFLKHDINCSGLQPRNDSQHEVSVTGFKYFLSGKTVETEKEK